MKNRTDRQKKAHGDVWFTFMANRAAADGMCSRRKLSCAKNLSWYMNEGQIYCCSGCSMCFIFPLWQFWRHAVKTGMMCFPSRPVLKEKTVFLAGTGVYMMQHLVKSFSSAVCGSLLSKSSSCACLTNSSGLCYFFIALLNIRFMQGDKNTSFNKSIRINLDLDRCCVKAWPWNGPSIQASLQNTCRAS